MENTSTPYLLNSDETNSNTMIIDGRTIASEILTDVRARVSTLPDAPIVRAIVMSPSPATLSYLAIKGAKAAEAGMLLDVIRLSEESTESDIINAITKPGADAIIVQLPLPHHINERLVLDTIPSAQDADVLSTEKYEDFLMGKARALLPPVVAAVETVLAKAHVELTGKVIVVIGSGRLVGKPVQAWLNRFDASVKVITTDSEAANGMTLLKSADVIISGAGSGGLITVDMLKEGVVLIDAGTSDSQGSLVGDADPACASVASVFTPVPGGMGPIAVACLFRNVAQLLDR